LLAENFAILTLQAYLRSHLLRL